MNIIHTFLRIFINSPFHPYWLLDYKRRAADTVILKDICGSVLEVGAGDGSRKEQLLRNHSRINHYEATDYSSWDGAFNEIDSRRKKYGDFGELFFGYKKRICLDNSACDAIKLPYKDKSFDYHISFQVLEHIHDPFMYFHEARRVIKQGGYIIVSVPFFYRIHGDEFNTHDDEPRYKDDYFRYGPGFFYNVAQKNNLDVVALYHNTGFGTATASITNQFVVRKIFESNYLVRVVFLFTSPFIFFIMNSIGFIIDIHPDVRFTTNFHVKMRRRK